jgi:SprT-like family
MRVIIARLAGNSQEGKNPMINLPAGTDLSHLKDIHDLGLKLMAEHGLGHWSLKWGRGSRQAGLCDRGKLEITISAPLMANWTIGQARDMILHEIAHALTVGGHTRQWQAKAMAIGGSGSVRWGHLGEADVPPKYIGTCPNGHISTKHRKSKAITNGASCGRCSPHFDRRFMIAWREA